MQALILAAGGGTRLGKKGEQKPKCLQEIGRRPLVDYQLEFLAEAGIAPVAMTVGYCADEIREAVGIRAEYIENPRWSATNSLYSFWLAREWVKGPLLVLNADTIFDKEILERLLDQEGDAFAYDSSSGKAREHMKVKLADGRLIGMSKTLPAHESCGENVGILKFTKETAEALFETAGELLKNGHEKSWLGSAVQKLARTHRINAVDVAGLPWGEIDCGYDLARVRREVLPALRRNTAGRRLARRVAMLAVAPLAMVLPTFLALHLWVAQGGQAWESTDLSGAERVTIMKGELQQTWWKLNGQGSAAAHVAGPGVVRIDSRLVLPADTADEIPYVLEIKKDGQRIDWFKHKRPASQSWKHSGSAVGSLASVDVDLSEGAHTLEVRLVAADSGHSLVRVRQQVSEDEDLVE